MSAKEKRWKRIYLFLMIFVYAIYVPVSVFEWLAMEERFPLSAFVVAVALPVMRRNHLKQLQSQDT
ncbi:hypothetical protein J31TS4_01930 [Paenibacillus sp. J31TS4]|uniref:hypothetical protein n=1 Tax=Paenibacillus sp. J31TS4 TaxID=2807195 RepID=UPI001B1ECB1B|nr:hypothetical protein [Paenibacillus sp. J31TS4]GIP36913.1 hypothetical protein J31TS4_01930 [Paenibacillus sp. J31TS4]